MQYNFDEILDRHGTFSYKWDCTPANFPDNPDALPFWVADMDFPSPQPIVDAIIKRAAHPIGEVKNSAEHEHPKIWFSSN